MNKRNTIFVSTSREHVKDHAMARLVASIQQQVETNSALTNTGYENLPITSAVSPQSLLLPQEPIYYTQDGITIYDDNGNRWGEIVDMIPIGDSSTETTIQLQALLSRTDDSTFEMPTRAQYVMDVWFDNLEAEPNYHYTFSPESTVLTVVSQPSGTQITALYLNKAEVI